MRRSVSLKIGQKEFKSQKAAVGYFMDQREAVKAVGPLKKGELFDELRDLYLRYCEIEDYSLGNREIYAFSVVTDLSLPPHSVTSRQHSM
ncbi:hypothetical protein [Escherichia coli]|uniref:hypothetical protein n=1 Tax=Escherichia coli TaxID=562 RepID=UPI0032083E2A